METCIQCKSVNRIHPVVAVMQYDESKMDVAVGLNSNGTWMAVPMCIECHQRPMIKAHFFPRSSMTHALDKAGSSTLGL